MCSFHDNQGSSLSPSPGLKGNDRSPMPKRPEVRMSNSSIHELSNVDEATLINIAKILLQSPRKSRFGISPRSSGRVVSPERRAVAKDATGDAGAVTCSLPRPSTSSMESESRTAADIDVASSVDSSNVIEAITKSDAAVLDDQLISDQGIEIDLRVLIPRATEGYPISPPSVTAISPSLYEAKSNIDLPAPDMTVLPPALTPSHDPTIEIDHIGFLLNTPAGFTLIFDSVNDLRCSVCTWRLRRRHARPFSKLGAPRKYGDDTERKEGRAKVRRKTRQLGIQRKKEEFWLSIHQKVDDDRSLMTPSGWRKKMASLAQYMESIDSDLAEQLGTGNGNEGRLLAQRAALSVELDWCSLKATELRRIVHS